MARSPFFWNREKDERLRQERGIGFADVEAAVDAEGLIADLPHPNPTKYPSQRIMIVEIAGETYVVPYVANDEGLFLKTAFPSRKARGAHGRPKTS